MKVVIFDDVLFRRQERCAVAGLELIFHEHADQAVEVVERERPDLVLMDFSMDAAFTGAEAVAALRGDGRFAALPIVAISADRDSNERMLRAGASDAVPKTHLRGFLRLLADRQRLAARLR